MTQYEINIGSRTTLHFLKGLMPRSFFTFKHEIARLIAKQRGAIIGKNTVIPLSLAIKANGNLTIGHNSFIRTNKLDLRAPISIGNFCILGLCEIITVSHYVDSPDYELKNYGIEIEDYSWITTYVLVTPACRKIGYGGVAGAGSVLVRNIEPMSIVSGNPAVHLRYRKQVHINFLPETQGGGDLVAYLRAYKNRNKIK
jgi:acetyltransferase-like isoleucine patch superfamily enzyme